MLPPDVVAELVSERQADRARAGAAGRAVARRRPHGRLAGPAVPGPLSRWRLVLAATRAGLRPGAVGPAPCGLELCEHPGRI